MLDRISSLLNRKKSPFTGLKSAQLWWTSQVESDAATQLQNMQVAISDYFSPDKVYSNEELQALMWLDSMVQSAFDSICFQYISNPRMPKEMERLLWREVSGFCACLVQAYANFIQAEGSIGLAHDYAKNMPLVLARSLRYVAIQAKWHYFRFEKVPSKLWKQASQCYRLAEVGGFDCHPFYPYEEVSALVSSCADEYLQMLMLATLSNNNLSVAQIHCVDQWLENWSKFLQLDRVYQAGHHHYHISLSEPSTPQKITGIPDAEGNRYWAIEDLVFEIRKTLARLEGGESSQELGLSGNLSKVAMAELLRHLDNFWSMSMRNAQTPRNPRVKVSKTINVIRGLDNLFASVKGDNDRYGKDKQTRDPTSNADHDEIMDMRLYGFVSSRTRNKQAGIPYALQNREAEPSAAWVVDNESIGGLGATLDFQKNEWARPGVLVGLRANSQESWKVAVLRRINRLSEEHVYAGIQVLASAPISVTIHAEETDKLDNITVTEIGHAGAYELPSARMAIYLPHKIDNSLANTLIMRPADYGQKRVYQVRAKGKSFSVSLGDVLEKGSDWIWVVVNVLRQEKP